MAFIKESILTLSIVFFASAGCTTKDGQSLAKGTINSDQTVILSCVSDQDDRFTIVQGSREESDEGIFASPGEMTVTFSCLRQTRLGLGELGRGLLWQCNHMKLGGHDFGDHRRIDIYAKDDGSMIANLVALNTSVSPPKENGTLLTLGCMTP